MVPLRALDHASLLPHVSSSSYVSISIERLRIYYSLDILRWFIKMNWKRIGNLKADTGHTYFGFPVEHKKA